MKNTRRCRRCGVMPQTVYKAGPETWVTCPICHATVCKRNADPADAAESWNRLFGEKQKKQEAAEID